MNPPLTPARISALSTRSVHPWTIDRINQVISSVGGAVTVTNPLLGHTKGEVCGLVRGSQFVTCGGLAATISCGSPRRRRSPTRDNCGTCFPCLVRRSGLLAAYGTDSTLYEREFAGLSPDMRTSADLRALMRWLSRPFGVRDLAADAPFPASVPISTVMATLRRGRAELAAMIDRLVPPDSALWRYWKPPEQPAGVDASPT